MSENTRLLSEEKGFKNPFKDSFPFNYILNCKYGGIHEFNLTFKDGHITIFPCDEVKLVN